MKLFTQLWRELWCKHDWRPALFYCRENGKHLAARQCDGCEKMQTCTDAEFYAQFGEIVHQVLRARV